MKKRSTVLTNEELQRIVDDWDWEKSDHETLSDGDDEDDNSSSNDAVPCSSVSVLYTASSACSSPSVVPRIDVSQDNKIIRRQLQTQIKKDQHYKVVNLSVKSLLGIKCTRGYKLFLFLLDLSNSLSNGTVPSNYMSASIHPSFPIHSSTSMGLKIVKEDSKWLGT